MARTDQPHKLTLDAWVAQCTDFDNPKNEKHRNLDYSRPETKAAWNGAKAKVPIWCNVHEEFFVQQPANHRDLGQGCPKCGKDVYKAKRRSADPVGDFRRTHGDLYDYSKVEYVNTHTHVEIICETHGPFRQKPLNHLQGEGCPECWQNRKLAFAAQRNLDYRSMYAERAARVHQGLYAILKLPEHSHDMVTLLCPRHGEFQQKAHVHLLGHGCWTCGAHAAQTQKEIAALIEGFGVRIEHENRTILQGMHIDIWAPEQKIGVEYHGMHWHTEERVGNKHRQKWERAEAAGIRLVQIFDFEWLGNRYAVEERLKALFGVSDSVGARKCELRQLERSEATGFFTKVHTQGRGSAPKVAYGLFDGPRLVAAMSFAPSRYTATGWELLRYASLGRVQGGFSRLLKAFIDEHDPALITSYCDLRWGDGRSYEAAGFALDAITEPDYWYADRERKVSRYTAQHRPKGQTEREWAEAHGYKKVLGVGHQRWVWRKQEAG